jgi:hypothetical protein
MPKDATATKLPEVESMPESERQEVAPNGENPIDKAKEVGNVVNIFRGRGEEEEKAIERLGQLDTKETEFAPEIAPRIVEANKDAEQNIEALMGKTLIEVSALLGNPPPPANETVPEPEVTQAVKVEEKLSLEQEDAEEQSGVAGEVMSENAEALQSFCEEHQVPLDVNMMKVEDASKLTKVERLYVQTLIMKYGAGLASKNHAEKLLEAYALPDGDPERVRLLEEAERLSNTAEIREKGAMAMQRNYLDQPEIMALAGSGGNESGGSVGGGNFEAQSSPFGQEPKKPGIIGASMYGEGGVPGNGITKIETTQTTGEKVEQRKPNFIEKFFNKNLGILTGREDNRE